VQFLWRERDPFRGLDVARRAVEVMPNVRLHEMNAGRPPFLDEPTEYGRIVNEFFSH
jgi:pimeloyl-ACP methyl ester carboxylesterase